MRKLDYGSKLREIRTFDLHTQEEIAAVLGISKNTYTQYELQNKIIPLKYLINFCDYYKISVDYILGFSKVIKPDGLKNSKDYKICDRIINFRKKQKLNITIFAESINIPRTTLTNYEKGRYMMSLDCLYSICKKYNISADYLLGRINYQPKLDFSNINDKQG